MINFKKMDEKDFVFINKTLSEKEEKAFSQFLKENKTVYLHCHAGINRSQTVRAAYYLMRTGEQLQSNDNGYINKLVAMCNRGYLPPKTEMEKFLIQLGKQLDGNLISSELMGGLLDDCKIETINNF